MTITGVQKKSFSSFNPTQVNFFKMLLLEPFSLKTKFKKLTKRMTELDVALPKVNLDIDDHKKIFARMS